MTKPLNLLATLLLLVGASTETAGAEEAAELSVLRPANSFWDDAASLRANRGLTESARRREAFQNPGVLDPRRLAQGFEEATRPLSEAGQEAGRYLQDGARQFADGTRGFVEQSGENLQNGARGLLEGTATQLERLDPTRRDAYGDRPGFGTNPQAPRSRLDPPAPSRTDDNRFDPSRQSQPLRGRVEPADAQQEYDRNRSYDPDYRTPAYDREPYPNDARGPAFSQPDRRSSDPGLAERFAPQDDRLDRADRSRVDPIPRRSFTSSRDDRFDEFGDDRSYARETAGRDRAGYPSARDEFDRRASADDFPSMPDRRTDSVWNDDFARGQSPPTTSGERYAAQRRDTTGFATGAGAGSSADEAVQSWNGSLNGGAGANNPNAGNNPNQNQAGMMNAGRDDAWDMDRFLLVILTAISCYVVIAHLDLRNRYRAALRGAPAGYGNPLREV